MALRQLQRVQLNSFTEQCFRSMSGVAGSGAGKGGGAGGSIKDAGGKIGEAGQAQEEQYFRKLLQEQMQKLREASERKKSEEIKKQ